MKNALLLALLPAILLTLCNAPMSAPSASVAIPMQMSGKINGLTFVAPPEPFPANPMPAVTEVGANWIAVIPYAFTRPGLPAVHFAENNNWQWWGESPAGVRETIRLAHAAGLKVMLKPQVYVPRGWTGALDFSATEDWAKWEADYERYILFYAQIAAEEKPEMLCIGTEFNLSIQKRPEFWQGLIPKIKGVFQGKLTYSANWDDWSRVPFWSELDYIGLGGYFPLVQETTPSVEHLRAAWAPIRDRLRDFSKAQGKPVLFTEFGYLSVDSCGWRNWELEHGIEQRNINEQAQANCYEALFSIFAQEDWWAGGFLWKWFPNMRGHEGYPERDYTPQGKTGEQTLRKWYGS